MGIAKKIITVLAVKYLKSAIKYVVGSQAFLLAYQQAGGNPETINQPEVILIAASLMIIEMAIDFLKEKFGWSWL